MNKRQKIKKGYKVKKEEVWNLDQTLTKFILPRLKEFKKQNTHTYPGRGDMNTPEKWHEAIDKMILSFQLLNDDCVDKYYDVLDSQGYDAAIKWCDDRNKIIKEGLHLFAEWYQDLWD